MDPRTGRALPPLTSRRTAPRVHGSTGPRRKRWWASRRSAADPGARSGILGHGFGSGVDHGPGVGKASGCRTATRARPCCTATRARPCCTATRARPCRTATRARPCRRHGGAVRLASSDRYVVHPDSRVRSWARLIVGRAWARCTLQTTLLEAPTSSRTPSSAHGGASPYICTCCTGPLLLEQTTALEDVADGGLGVWLGRECGQDVLRLLAPADVVQLLVAQRFGQLGELRLRLDLAPGHGMQWSVSDQTRLP